jgi:CelD/BcsL family acetyltransferase involved in cellulose biosynthesis
MHVREINNLAELLPLRDAWSHLLEATPNATFFESFDWLQAYWRHFGAGQRLRVLAVSQEDQLVGILPLVVTRERTRVGTLRMLTYPLANWGSHFGPIGPRPEETLSAGLAHVRLAKRDWDFVELRFVRQADIEQGWTRQAMRRVGWQAYRTRWGETAVVDLAGTWDQWLAARGSKWRNNYKRWQRRLADRGAVEYQRFRPVPAADGSVDPRWDVYDVLERIAASSWQAASRDGTTLSSPAIRGFLRDAHAAASQVAAADMNLLRIAGRPAAFVYGYCYRGVVFGLRAGYDPATAEEGAGNVLYAEMIRDSFLRGDRLFDMGPGSLDAKRHFLTRTETIYRYSHYHPTALRAQLVRLKRRRDAAVEQRQATGAGR